MDNPLSTNGKLLFAAFIVLIIGLALIRPIADSISEKTTTQYDVTNETYTSAATITLSHDELIKFTEMRNQTATEVNGLCNSTLSTGILTCNTTSSTNLYTDYTYEADNYLRSATERSILSISTLFFALAVFAIGLAFALKSLRSGKLM